MDIVTQMANVHVCQGMLALTVMQHALQMIQQQPLAITHMVYARQIHLNVSAMSHLVVTTAPVQCVQMTAIREVSVTDLKAVGVSLASGAELVKEFALGLQTSHVEAHIKVSASQMANAFAMMDSLEKTVCKPARGQTLGSVIIKVIVTQRLAPAAARQAGMALIVRNECRAQTLPILLRYF